MRRLDCIQKVLEKLFYKYGKLVGRQPLPFIIGPILVSALLGLGLMKLYSIEDAEELYAPTNGPARDERKIVQSYFPENDSYNFIATRRTILDGSLQIVLTRKGGGNVYTEEGIGVALEVDALVKEVTIQNSGQSYSYSELCAAWKGQCIENTILVLLNMTAENVNTINLTYPFHTQTGFSYFTGNLLGGVTLKPVNVVDTAEALYLAYSLKYQTDQEAILADAFLRMSVEQLQKYQNNSIKVDFQTSLSLDDELTAATNGIVVLFSITYFIITFFASVSCNMLDPVRSKAWVATGGEIAAALAILSAFGLMSAAGVPFTSTVGSVPFLIMGIGIDDMFVIVSSWRHTSYTWSVEERMGKTFETAAISITVTSITDALAFCIGSVTAFKAVTYFCAYAGIAVLFSYIYAITFCAACLAYSGRIEHQNRHSTACCIQTLPKSSPELLNKSGCFKAVCTGGDEIHILHPSNEMYTTKRTLPIDNGANGKGDVNLQSYQDIKAIGNITENTIQCTKSSEIIHVKGANETTDIIQPQNGTIDAQNNTDPEDLRYSVPLVTDLIKDYIAKFILHRTSKIVISLLYLLYLSLSIWGCISLQEGLHVKNLAPDGSYVVEFYDNYDKYFYSQYGPKVMVVFTDTLDYYKTSVQVDIQNQLKIFRDDKYFETEDTLTESWLSEYSNYLNMTGQVVADMPSFINVLRNQFLRIEPYDRFTVDISFNDNFSAIKASRFMIQAEGITSSLDERDLMQNARRIAEESSYSITVFAAGFIFYDQYVVIVKSTLQNLGIAVVCMMVVAAVLLPSLLGVIFVTISVVSICTGVVGFMVFWDVNLDSISMINLIMCIGFSVDFSAHISYHFSVSSGKTGDDKAMEALTYIGWPIIQGALSTILGVVVLSFSDTYIFRTFFKLMFLVMVFGFCHAFFLLPVILSLTQSVKTFICSDKVGSSHESIGESTGQDTKNQNVMNGQTSGEVS